MAKAQGELKRAIDKVVRYGWGMKDSPGTMMLIHKDDLKVNAEYQREAIQSKVLSIASEWSWISLGAIVVAVRDRAFWVIDGQHRVLAAKRRSDITTLPCVVFETDDVQSEARGFLDLNTGRKPVTAVAKQHAMVAAGDELAIYVQQQIEALGLEIRPTANVRGQIKAVKWCYVHASESKSEFLRVLSLGAEMCTRDDIPVAERLLDGLWILNARCGDGLKDKRLVARLREKGALSMLAAASRAAAFYAAGGSKVWAQGMLTELNKGLQKKFSMSGVED